MKVTLSSDCKDQEAIDWLSNASEKINSQLSSEMAKAVDDMSLFGTGFILDGKHVPLADVNISKHLAVGKIEKGYSKSTGLIFSDVFSVSVSGNNAVFTDECDGNFKEVIPKDEAVEMLECLIDYIKSGVADE